jgi:hypothetical protein
LSITDSMRDRRVSRRDFLRLRRSERGKVLELSCRTLFMRCSDAGASAPPDSGASEVEAHEPWMGEPAARLHRRSATAIIDSIEEELRDTQVLRLLDPEWLDSIEGAPRLEAVIDAFRLRGGVVERSETG